MSSWSTIRLLTFFWSTYLPPLWFLLFKACLLLLESCVTGQNFLFVVISLLDSYFCRLKNLQMFLSPPVDRKSWILILFPQFTYNWLFFLHLPKIILNIVLDPKLKYMWLIRSIFDGQMIFWMSTLLPPGLERAFAQSLVEL